MKGDEDAFFGAFVNSLNHFEAVGGEIVVNWQPKQGHAIALSYGYSELHNETPSQNRFPQHLIKMSLTNTFFDERLVTSFDLLYNSGYDTDKYVLGVPLNLHFVA